MSGAVVVVHDSSEEDGSALRPEILQRSTRNNDCAAAGAAPAAGQADGRTARGEAPSQGASGQGLMITDIRH